MSAILASTAAGSAVQADTGTGTGALDAQKAQCERQLSDWVHCVSAKTPEGKAKIAEYSSKLSAINTQIQQAEQARSAARQAQSPAAQDTSANASITPTRRPQGPLGHNIDTYA